MIKVFLLGCLVVVLATVGLFGFRGQKTTKTPIEIFPDMDHQAKVKSQKPSEFFGDGKGDRLAVPGTVPMGFAIPEEPRQANPDQILEAVPWSATPYSFTAGNDYFNTGKIGEFWGDGIPVEVNEDLLARGKERYAIHCTICHGESGNGLGTVAQYQGFKNLVASYHQDRLREIPDGNLYNTIAYGKGLMYGYAENLSVYDRWAIVAYIRLLQASQYAEVASLPEDVLAQISKSTEKSAEEQSE